ncbi:MAG TPA: EamA/RhaT family transporter [Paenalcaligenes sp.]|nr:EamA/RhaT family transporter [Paenalcaligenes sp.]
MWFLVFSITCSVSVSILLKLARRYSIHVSQAIAANYVMASALTLLLLQPRLDNLWQPGLPLVVLLLLGLLLPSIFIVMAYAVQQAGIVRSDAAQRLSLLIPLLAAFLLFNEPYDHYKLGGIVCGLLAIGFLSLHKDAAPGHITKPQSKHKPMILLFGVWVGYGLIDILFKQLAQSDLSFISSLIITFMLAGLLMFGGLAYRRTAWHLPSLFGGLVLGLFNFGNIYFYIRAHQQFPHNPALVFAAMNIGVIVLGTITGVGLFKERATGRTGIGLLFALAAILLLLP